MVRDGNTAATFSLPEELVAELDTRAENGMRNKSQIVEDALREHFDNGCLSRVEKKVDTIRGMLEEGTAAPSEENENSHTHSPEERESVNTEKSAKSDGGVVAAPTTSDGLPTTQFDSLAEYDADLPAGYELTRGALKTAPSAVRNGAAINPEHFDVMTIQSRGFPVAAKQALVAGVIRYQRRELVTEREVLNTAEELLGTKRQAKDKFDGIVSYFEPDVLDTEKTAYYLSREDAANAAKEVLEESQRIIRQEDLADGMANNANLAARGLQQFRSSKAGILQYGVIASEEEYDSLEKELQEIYKAYLRDDIQ